MSHIAVSLERTRSKKRVKSTVKKAKDISWRTNPRRKIYIDREASATASDWGRPLLTWAPMLSELVFLLAARPPPAPL